MERDLRLLLPRHREEVEGCLDVLCEAYPDVARGIDVVFACINHRGPVACASRFDRCIQFNVVKLNVHSWSPRGVRHLVAHEFGHHVQFRLEDKLSPEEVGYYAADFARGQHVSAYADQRPSELFAEMFALFTTWTSHSFIVEAMESMLSLI